MNSLGRIPLCVPSKGRAELTAGSYLVELAQIEDFRVIYVVPESEEEEYKRCLPSSVEIVPFPDEFEGNLSAKRNWITNNLFDKVIGFFDDDVAAFRWIGGDIMEDVSPEIFLDIVLLGIDLCDLVGARVFGFEEQVRPKFLNPPFRFNAVISDTAMFQLERLYRDERILIRSDIDLVCREIAFGFPVVKFGYVGYATMKAHGFGSGGLRAITKREQLKNDTELIISKWGSLGEKLVSRLRSGVYYTERKEKVKA